VIQLRALSSVAQLACSATTQASANNSFGTIWPRTLISGHRSPRCGGLLYLQNSASRRGRRT
jgi:hypothetical protein